MSSSTLPRIDQQLRKSAWRVLLVGPPGAGKSTHGVALAERFDVPYVSTGALLREEVRRRSRVGQHAADYMNMGRLVPDWLTMYALERRLGDVTRSGFVLDGYPRTLEQAERFTESLGPLGLDRVVELAVPDGLAMARLVERHRADDDQPVARARLRTYRMETEPMLEFFAAAGLLTTLDGARSRESVGSDLIGLFDNSAKGTLTR
jgi:adenylate kinase